MDNKKRNTKHVSQAVTSGVACGLAQMEDYWKAEDGEIEECSAALWGSWPVREALKAFHDDPEAVLATLAGRMFLAGEYNTQIIPVQPTAVLRPLPGSDPTTATTAVIDALAQALYAVPQDGAEQVPYVADRFENLVRQPGVSTETRSILGELVVAFLAIKQKQIMDALKQNPEALLEHTPQDQIDADVDDILRRSEEEGGAQ